MIIKKFVEKDSRSAMAKVRDEFGADAVVLSSRSVGDSFELIAAANYDEYDVLQQYEEQEQQELSPKGPAAVVHLPTAPNADAPVKQDVSEAKAANEPADRDDAASEESGPSLQTLQTELAGLRELIQNELPKYSSRSHVAAPITAIGKNRSTLNARLARMGISKSLSADLLGGIDESGSVRESWQRLVSKMVGDLQQNEETLLENGGIAAFVGPVGSGKTSTVAKIASAHLATHGRGDLGLITTSGVNDKSNERLLKFARAMGVPCIEAKTATNLKAAVEEFSDKKLVLIDTPGMDRNDLRLTMQLAEFRLANHPIDNYLVLSAEADSKTLEKTINAFSRYKPVGLVVTKVDKSLNLGGLIEILIRKRDGLSYISDGTRIPGDLHVGGAKIILKKALSLLNGPALPKRKAPDPQPVMKPKRSNTLSNRLQRLVGERA